MVDANRPLKWFFIYAREIGGETYYLADDLEPIRNRVYGVLVHPVKEAYEFVGALQNRSGSTFERFLENDPGSIAFEHISGPARIVGGWRLGE